MILLKRIALILLAVGMVSIGVLHFIDPEPFERIVPPAIGAPRFWVWLSGFFEVLGGVGLLIPKTRRAAGWGLVALFVAVFPANIYMAVAQVPLEAGGDPPGWVAWARLPVQVVFIAWALWTSAPPRSRPPPES